MEPANLTAAILSGYERDADTLIERYEAVSPDDKYRVVADLLPRSPCNVVDIGSGSGVDSTTRRAST